MRKASKHPEQMSVNELARATRAFDRPFSFEAARPLTSAERAEERVLRRGRGRPKIGKGVKKVSISLETELLAKADAIAEQRGLNRSELIAALVAAGLRKAS